MTRLSVSFLETNEAVAASFPRTGVAVRAIPSSKQRDWQLLQLDSRFDYRGKACEWLLIRSWDKGVDREGSQASWAEVLLVGASPHVADGFDESSFENIGDAVVDPVHFNLSRWQKFWIRFSLIALVLAGAGWWVWHSGDSPPSSFGRFVVKLLFLIPELVK